MKGEWEYLPAGFTPDEPLYVITDIHGCSEAMRRLLDERPPDTRLVFLGDAVDKGPDPLGVIAELMKDERNILIHGNHDAMAWFAQPDVEAYGRTRQDWWGNGGRRTQRIFKKALEDGMEPGELAPTVPMLFEDFWFRGNEWWQSGNLLFVHAGLPRGEGREWLAMPPMRAVVASCSPYWYRNEFGENYSCPRYVDGKEVFVVFGHTPNYEGKFALLPHAMALDAGYLRKWAVEIQPGKPARVRLITTYCDEI